MFKKTAMSCLLQTRDCHVESGDEQGRSLTEMMGTLAIMGILAIAGIWMYNSAMDRLKANTIINEAQKRAVVVAGQIGFQDRTDPSLGEFSENEFAGSTFSQSVITHGLYKQFGIQVSGVSQNVCQNILNSIGDSTPLRRLTGVGSPRTALTTCAEDNTFLMIYNNDMSDSVGDTAYTCEKDSDCSACGTCNTETHACENDCEVQTPNGGCDFDNECNQDNECMICNEETHLCEDGCQRVEYLQSTGNQYINTGVIPAMNTGVKIDMSWNSFDANDNYVLGCRDTNGDTRFWAGEAHSQSENRKLLRGAIGKFTTSGVEITANDRKILQFNYNGDNKTYWGNIGYTLTNSITFTATRPMYLFAANDRGTVALFTNVKIYNTKIYEGTKLIRDFIPVHAPFKTDGKQNCLFDRMSGDLFCNAGTGDFKTNLTP